MTHEEILADYEDLEEEDIGAVLAYCSAKYVAARWISIACSVMS